MPVKEGLDRDEALRSLKTNPAQMLGLDDRVGSLTAGLDADVVIWSGDPLEVMSRALRVYIGGREVYGWDESAGPVRTADPDALLLTQVDHRQTRGLPRQ